MHDEFSPPESGPSVITTVIAFAAGIALGMNITAGPTAATSDRILRTIAEAPAPRLPALPPEVAMALTLGPMLHFVAADESRECTADRDQRCIFN